MPGYFEFPLSVLASRLPEVSAGGGSFDGEKRAILRDARALIVNEL